MKKIRKLYIIMQKHSLKNCEETIKRINVVLIVRVSQPNANSISSFDTTLL